MAFDYNPNNKSKLSAHIRRFFVTVLLFNFLVACVYCIHVYKVTETQDNVQLYYQPFNLKLNENQSMALLRNVLEHDYDRRDLQAFYSTAKKAFASGLRCPTVNGDLPSAPTKSGKKLRSSLTTTIAPRQPSSPLQLHRTFYPFVIYNLDACSAEPLDLLIIVISKCSNFKTRDAIRRTWGSRSSLASYPSISVRLLFLLDVDEKLDRSVRLENELFHDIIQVELPQQYTLVTHRELSLWEWSFRFCRSAKYLFKTDDDIFINIVALLKFVSPLLELPSDKSFRTADMSLYGYKYFVPSVFRTANNSVEARYIVTKDEYPCDLYPSFLSGFGYLIPKKTRDAILYASFLDLNEPFRLSDVYVTAILPEYLSLARISMAEYSIRYEGSCEEFFTAVHSFACAGDSHYGNTSDVFYSYYRYWTQVNKFL